MRSPACSTAAFQMRRPIAAAAQRRAARCRSRKRESTVVVDAGNRRCRRAVELDRSESHRASTRGKARGVAEAGISSHSAAARSRRRRRSPPAPSRVMRRSLWSFTASNSRAWLTSNTESSDRLASAMSSRLPTPLPFSARPISSRTAGSSIVAGIVQALAVGDLLHGAAQDLARARLRQPRHGDRELEGGDRPDLARAPARRIPARSRPAVAVDAGLQHDEAAAAPRP